MADMMSVVLFSAAYVGLGGVLMVKAIGLKSPAMAQKSSNKK